VVAVLLGVVLLYRDTHKLNVISLGDEEAHHLGIDVEALRRRVFLISSLVVGVIVSVAGLIGFVGMIVPHALRLILGPDHRLLLPASAVLGAAFLVAADAGARFSFSAAHHRAAGGVITAPRRRPGLPLADAPASELIEICAQPGQESARAPARAPRAGRAS